MLYNQIYYFLERLPTHVHIYIASRTQPLFSLSRFRLEGDLNEIGIDDLRFYTKEAKTFFDQCTDLLLSEDECNTIHTQSEGWIAGMRVVALSLNDKRGQQGKDVLAALTGKQRNFADYFFEEVLINQSQERQQFLLKTSILNRINVKLSEALTNLPHSRLILQQLEKENLFIIGLDEKREWFRYHHLFQEFLQMQLQVCFPQELKSLHRIAGTWLEEHNLIEEALDYYLVGECYEEAIDLLEKLILSLPNDKWKKLHKWLSRIPNHLLFRKPTLFLTNAASLYFVRTYRKSNKDVLVGYT